ncbi:hypothetical protein A2U01_0067791, partial [Trifolium medium]|nr:hypothetical protein [Trifolium medium]
AGFLNGGAECWIAT